MARLARAYGVHLVGSIRLPDEPLDPLANTPSPETIFRSLSKALSGRLRRLPDGETGIRHYFANWQERVFEPSPWIFGPVRPEKRKDVPDAKNLEIKLNSTGYDEAAINSYEAFSALQNQGVIEPDVRFQVSIPTPINTLCRHVAPEFQAKVEPMYEKLLLDSISNIQAHFPSEKLAIQLDVCLEFAVIEGISGPGGAFKPWFEPSFQNILQRVVRIASAVNREVHLGFHFCYGGLRHQHFVEPQNTSTLVKVANALADQVVRPLNFIHMPVPKDRTDDEYFADLRDLRLPETDVYLGLVHPDDLQGTKARIAAARKIMPQFGVATECGWGRTPPSHVGSILEILFAVTGPE